LAVFGFSVTSLFLNGCGFSVTGSSNLALICVISLKLVFDHQRIYDPMVNKATDPESVCPWGNDVIFSGHEDKRLLKPFVFFYLKSALSGQGLKGGNQRVCVAYSEHNKKA